MGWNTQHRKLSGSALILMGMAVMQSVNAAPPPRIQLQGRTQIAAQVRPQPAAPMQIQQHLDLRPPSHMPEASEDAEQRSFPSRRPNMAAQEAVQLPALGVESVRARPTVQEFVRRVRQEGLPVARLYEGRSALVHLGLNPKGKPGLWLVQKTR
jgi:hypothetical protein